MTTIPETSLFFMLPTEIQWKIVWEVIEADSGEGFRRTNKKCLTLYDAIMESKWNQLKSKPLPGLIDFPFQMQKVEQAENEKPIKYIRLFKKLNELFKSLGFTIPKGPLNASTHHFAAMQEKKLEIILEKIWNRIKNEFEIMVPFFNNYKEVGSWIKSSESRYICVMIDDLNLSNSGINFIPEEVSFFPNLEVINLSGNHINQLPDFLGSMTQLRHINLEGNCVAKLPEMFSKWVHIKKANFDKNPLSQSAQEQIAEWNKEKAKCEVVEMKL